MDFPSELKYTKDHEWVRVEGNIATVGITDYAQGQLGDVVFVELPAVGAKLTEMQPFGTIEAVKAVSELFAPLSGEVKEINKNLGQDSSVINSDPYGAGWLIKITNFNAAEVGALLNVAQYRQMVED